MEITKKQIQLAEKIDRWIKSIERSGGGDTEILEQMLDYMPLFKEIMDTASPGQMNLLSETYPGFYRFGKFLELLAAAIRDGVIKVPK